MSEIRFTPGPWRYQEKSDAYTHIVRAGEHTFICQLQQDTSGRAEADARLIAAAPEMLAALQECQSALAMMVSPNSIEQTTVANAFAAATAADVKARAAISKAEGRQP